MDQQSFQFTARGLCIKGKKLDWFDQKEILLFLTEMRWHCLPFMLFGEGPWSIKYKTSFPGWLP